MLSQAEHRKKTTCVKIFDEKHKKRRKELLSFLLQGITAAPEVRAERDKSYA